MFSYKWLVIKYDKINEKRFPTNVTYDENEKRIDDLY